MKRALIYFWFIFGLVVLPVQALPGQSGVKLGFWLQQHPQLLSTLKTEEDSYLAAQVTMPDGRHVQVKITGSVFQPDYFVKHIHDQGQVEKVIFLFEPVLNLYLLSDHAIWSVIKEDNKKLLKYLFPLHGMDKDFVSARLLYSGEEYWSPHYGIDRYKMDSVDWETRLIGKSRFFEGSQFTYELAFTPGEPAFRCIIHTKGNARREIAILHHNARLYKQAWR